MLRERPLMRSFCCCNQRFIGFNIKGDSPLEMFRARPNVVGSHKGL